MGDTELMMKMFDRIEALEATQAKLVKYGSRMANCLEHDSASQVWAAEWNALIMEIQGKDNG